MATARFLNSYATTLATALDADSGDDQIDLANPGPPPSSGEMKLAIGPADGNGPWELVTMTCASGVGPFDMVRAVEGSDLAAHSVGALVRQVVTAGFLELIPLDNVGQPQGDYDMNGQRLTNLPEPADDNDAATKLYVDTEIAGIGGDAGLAALVANPGDLIVGGNGGDTDHAAGTTTGWSHNTTLDYGTFPDDLTDDDDGTNVGFASQVGGIEITYHAPAPIAVSQFSFSQDGAGDPSGRNAWVLESSPDGSAWTTRLTIDSGEAQTTAVYDLDDPATAEYWRLRATTDTGSTWNVRQFGLIGGGGSGEPETLSIGAPNTFVKVNPAGDGYVFGLPPGNGGDPGIAMRDEFGMTRFATKAMKVENVAIPSGDEVDLLTVPDEGTVTAFTFVTGIFGGGEENIQDGVIKIYVDEEVSPSIVFDLGTLGSRFMDATKVVQQTDNIAIEAAPTADSALSLPSFQFTFKFPIFFGNSVKFAYENPTADDTLAFLNVFYTNDIVQNRRLKSAGITWADKVTHGIGDGDYDLLDLASGNAGTIVWHSLAAQGASGNGFLESNVVARIDGEGSPSIQTSGTEDWFCDSFYWAAGPRSTPFAYLGTLDLTTDHTVACAVDLLALFGGISFTDGVKLSWELEDSELDFATLVLYYLGEDATPGNVPVPPDSGVFVLTATDGVIAWVAA